MSDKNSLSGPQVFKSVLDLATNIRDEDIICEKRCKLCNLSLRQEAEQYWESKRRNCAAVVRFLDDRDVPIDEKSVSSHMWKHFYKQQKRLAIRDYAEKLKVFEGVRADRLANLALGRAVLLNELLEIGEQSDKLDLIERRKSAELMIKLVASIVEIEKSEKSFYDEWKPAKIIVEKLQQIVQIEVADANIETKQLLAKVVETLYDSCEGIQAVVK